MKLFDQLNEDNFLLYAAKCYYNPRCIDAEEFYDDLNRFKYVKRLINRYIRNGRLVERLLLNHITIVLNVFGNETGIVMLMYKVGPEGLPALKSFLLYLKAIKENELTTITHDREVADRLREI
jgi:hypothetical protein